MSVLVITLSWITWVPGLVVFIVQAGLSGWQWTIDNVWIAGALVIGSVIWIVLLSLLALALSAWVKWRFVAGALLLGILFLGAGFAQAINAVLKTHQGYLIDVLKLFDIVWRDLFRDNADQPLPASEAWIALTAIAAFCLYLLMRKVKANEVVR
jgi:ABC-2 type transport system permease protein